VDKCEILNLQRFPCLDRLRSKCSIVDTCIFEDTLLFYPFTLFCHREEYGVNMEKTGLKKYAECYDIDFHKKFHYKKNGYNDLSLKLLLRNMLLLQNGNFMYRHRD
jgi:hypothetical protein